MLLTDLPQTLRSGGCRVEVDPGFATRGQGALSSVKAIMCHHTGSVSTSTWKVVRDGREGLRGLLSQLVLERDGLWRVLGSGQAWHAGSGGPLLGIPMNSANSCTIGIEAVSAGTTKGDWTTAQLTEYPRGVAALCRRYGLTEQQVIFHKTWAPTRKIDLAGWPGDLAAFRASVATHLRQEDTMSQAEVDQIKSHIDRQIGFARDQILTALAVDEPVNAPTGRTPEGNVAVAPARRVDVGYALEQITALIKALPSCPAGDGGAGPLALTDTDVQRVAAAVLSELSKRTAA